MESEMISGLYKNFTRITPINFENLFNKVGLRI